MIDKNRISNSFSKYASYYDNYCSIQNICANELIQYITEDNFKDILEIGAGTANYTYLLKKKYPTANIIALDIAAGMINIAKKKIREKNVHFIISDAESFKTNKKFDLVTSNASLQWFGNLKDVLYKYKQLLSKNGVIAFSIFGPKTFTELKLSFRELFKDRIFFITDYFIDKYKLEEIMQEIFDKIEIKKNIYIEECSSLIELLKKIKYTGVNVWINKLGLFTPKMLDSIEKIYKKNFGKIKITYEVFFIKNLI